MRKMKDSGIEWIGEIPEKWAVQKVKLNFSIISGNGFKEQYQGKEQGDYPFCKASDINGNEKIISSAANYVDNNIVKIEGYNVIPPYSIIMAKIGEALKKNHRKINAVPCIIDNNCQALAQIKNNNLGYLYYLLTQIDMSWFDNSGTVPCVNNTAFKNSYICLPPLPEQQQIADYLNVECSKIDSLVSDIEKQITTLEQYKRSVITEAVTKGLDPAVPMKDSGIEWIGEIPEEWKVKPVYCYFGERKYRNYRAAETNLLSLSYGKIVRKDINTNEGLLPESFNTYNIVEDGDIIIRPTDLQNDKKSLRTGLCKERGIITSAYIALKPIQPANTDYFHYLLHSYDIMKVFYNMGNGVRQGLNFSEFSRLMLLEPPRNQQDEIVTYLDDKCTEIDSAISLKKQQIETLNDYKKSLIYEYVTGKKEIPV